jgi:hypothetical protein
MVRFIVDIEAGTANAEAVNILLKTNSNQPTEAEEMAAGRLLPALRDLLETRFPESDESPRSAPVLSSLHPKP